MTDIEKAIIEYLAKKPFITLATCSSDGLPITHPIAHVTDGATVYFVTDQTTRKVQNIKENKNERRIGITRAHMKIKPFGPCVISLRNKMPVFLIFIGFSSEAA